MLRTSMKWCHTRTQVQQGHTEYLISDAETNVQNSDVGEVLQDRPKEPNLC